MMGIAKCLGLSPVVALALLEDASMHRLVVGILVLVLGMSVVAAEEEGQDKKPATPEQRYKALLKEYNDAFQEYAKAFRAAATPQDRRKVAQEMYPRPDKYASKVLE